MSCERWKSVAVEEWDALEMRVRDAELRAELARAEGRRETLAEAARWFEAEGYGYASTLLSALSAPATTVGEGNGR